MVGLPSRLTETICSTRPDRPGPVLAGTRGDLNPVRGNGGIGKRFASRSHSRPLLESGIERSRLARLHGRDRRVPGLPRFKGTSSVRSRAAQGFTAETAGHVNLNPGSIWS
jgi:hypothetical protein